MATRDPSIQNFHLKDDDPAKTKEGTVSVLGASFLLWTDVAGVGALAAGYNILNETTQARMMFDILATYGSWRSLLCDCHHLASGFYFR